MKQDAPIGLSIVVPVYNGERTVANLVSALVALEVDGGLEIILVNDDSPDKSLDVCRAIASQTQAVLVTVVNLARNFGEHNAVMAGLHFARGAYVISMDDDLQNPPTEVRKLYDYTRTGSYDVVYSYYAQKQHAGWRNLGSRFNGWIASLLLDKPKGLYLSSFRCMSAFLVRQITRYSGPFPYIDGLILQNTKRIGRLQVEHLPRMAGRSNYTLRRLIRLWLAMALNFSVMPLRIATLFGIALCALGSIGLILVLLEAIFGAPPSGWSSIVSLILILSGAQLLMLGVVGEYLGRLFLTVNNQPQSCVRDVQKGDGPPLQPE